MWVYLMASMVYEFLNCLCAWLFNFLCRMIRAWTASERIPYRTRVICTYLYLSQQQLVCVTVSCMCRSVVILNTYQYPYMSSYQYIYVSQYHFECVKASVYESVSICVKVYMCVSQYPLKVSQYPYESQHKCVYHSSCIYVSQYLYICITVSIYMYHSIRMCHDIHTVILAWSCRGLILHVFPVLSKPRRFYGYSFQIIWSRFGPSVATSRSIGGHVSVNRWPRIATKDRKRSYTTIVQPKSANAVTSRCGGLDQNQLAIVTMFLYM